VVCDGSVEDGGVVVVVAGSVLVGGDEVVVGDVVVVVSGMVDVGTSDEGTGGNAATSGVVVVTTGGRRFLRGVVVGTVSGCVDATGGSVIATVVESSMAPSDTEVADIEVDGACAISGID
jgi:predicted RecA/RadA family phage recombinase